MGVHGLWRLIEPSGKPVPLETLENKVLAVDISIWLHQAIKGFQDSKGAPLPNAHLLGIYHRVCKLLYFKIKPVFVFDGGVPLLKKQTIAKRNQLKSRNQSEADRLQKQLLNTLLKHTAITNVLSEKTKATISSSPPKKSPGKSKGDTIDDLYALPSAHLDSTISSSSEDDFDYSETSESTPTRHLNIHNIDTESKDFKALPADVRYELLSELKETRKQSSWGRLHEMPTKSDDFSSYQMGRLLQRQTVQSELEKTEKEMGGHSLSLGELENLMNDQGVLTKNDTVGKRIASDENTRYLLIRDIKQAIEEAKREQQALRAIAENDEGSECDKESAVVDDKSKANPQGKLGEEESKCEVTSTDLDMKKGNNSSRSKADIEYEEDLRKAIILSHLEKLAKPKDDNATIVSSSHSCSSGKDVDYEEDLEKAMKLSKLDKLVNINNIIKNPEVGESSNKVAKDETDLEEDEELQKAIQLSLECTSSKQEDDVAPSQSQSKFDITLDFSFMNEDSESSDEETLVTKMTSAQNYMMEYSGLTPSEIAKIIKQRCAKDKPANKKYRLKKSKSHKISSEQKESSQPDYKNIMKKTNKVESAPEKQVRFSEKESVVEIMSDSSDSDDLVDVTEESQESKTKIEIIIKPDEELEDDLFSDVFGSEAEKNQSEAVMNANNLKSNIEDNEADVAKRESSPEKEVPSIIKVREIGLQDVNKPENLEESKIADNISSTSEKQPSPAKELKDNPESTLDDVENELSKLHSGSEKNVDEVPVDTLNIENKIATTSNSASLEEIKDEEIKTSDKTVQENSNSASNMAESQAGSLKENIKEKTPEISRLSVEEMREIKEGLRKEQFQLQTEKSLKERLAGNITDQMYQEAQELLQLFGVPYIIAPMEAEAQCAFLDEADLTDGTITDDSDIWLFGGKTVYKNFFNQSKHVMEFRAENILHHFKLTREQMILLALLVGSDYTTGIQGVGPVTALEILAAFPPVSSAEFSVTHNQLLSGLAEFRNWFTKGRTPGLGRNTLRSKLKNVKFSENFPSVQVVQAYLEPTVETSREPFSWGKPDFVGLVDFARQKFGWTLKKSEEILNPVIKKLEEKHKQKTIREYFKTKAKIYSTEPENKMSKRVKTAVKRIGNEPVDEDEVKPKPKRTRKKKEPEAAGGTSKDSDLHVPEGEVETKEGEGEIEKNEELKEPVSDMKGKKTRRNTRKKKNEESLEALADDEDFKILQATVSHSSKRVKQIDEEVKSEMKKARVKKVIAPNLHKKEIIHQRERDKAELLKKKLKAIEVFRKSEKGPGFVKKRQKTLRAPKVDAGLSESSDDE